MRARHLLLTVTLLMLLTAGCVTGLGSQSGNGQVLKGSGTTTTDTRSLSSFTAIDLRAVGTLTVVAGSSPSIEIQGEDNLVPIITTGVSGGRLTIGWKSGTGTVVPTRPISYRLTVPASLTEVAIHGGGALNLPSMTGDTLNLSVDGAGTIAVDRVTARAVVMRISGAGQITLAGQTTQQQLTISGAGNYRATDLASQQAEVTIDGAGNATVRVSDTLTATINGIGSVRYIGQPQVTRHGTGLGQVVPLQSQ